MNILRAGPISQLAASEPHLILLRHAISLHPTSADMAVDSQKDRPDAPASGFFLCLLSRSVGGLPSIEIC